MKRVVGAVVVVALVAGLGWAAWWWTHPTVLTSSVLDDEGGLVGARVEPGEAVYVALAEVDPGGAGEVLVVSGADVDLTPARGTEAEVVACTERNGADDRLATGGEQDMPRYCSGLRPLDGDLRLDGREQRQSLFLRLEVAVPGRVRLDGVTVDYRRTAFPWQRGSQRIGADFVARVR